MPTGTSIGYVGGTTGLPVPKATGHHPTHRPWCTRCKTKHDPGDLNTDGHCTTCARIVVRIAEAAAHRAAEAPAQVQASRAGFDVEEAMRRYAAGDPAIAIAADLGCNPNTIYAVAAASTALDEAVDRITRPDDHAQPPTAPSPPIDVPARLDELIDQLSAVRARVAHDLADIESALDHLLNTLTPAPVFPRDGGTPEDAAPVGKPAVSSGTPRPARRTARPRKPRIENFPLDDARRLYVDDHLTIPKIAEKLGTTPATVRRHLTNAAVPMRDDRGGHSGGRNAKTIDDYDPQLVADIRRLYLDEELTTTQVGEHLGHTPKLVATILKRAGIPRRPAASVAGRKGRDIKLNDAKRGDICRRYQAGESTVDLAAAYDVSTVTVTAVLDRAGIPRRSASAARKNHLNKSGDTPA